MTMQLHEFMSAHREEILNAIQVELEGDASAADDHVRAFYDETLAALRRDSGIRDSFSPLPGESESAARIGVTRQRAGVPVAKVAAVYAAISQAVGQTGEQYELRISADEYKRLNKCLDAGIATSIENFWRREKRRTEQLITERYGHMAHELRNALGNVNMAFKLMRAGSLDVHGRTGDVLGRNLARMGALVGQCLGSVQIDVGKVPELVPVHVAEMLRDVEASAIPDRGINIVLEVDEVLFIRADEMLFSSAVSNLVHNAVKFSRPESTIHVSARSQDEVALIEVEDECGGLGQHTLETLCEAYTTGRSSETKGIGLGLSITKQAIEAMHGELRVVDRPGHGCTFTLVFPLLSPS
jgi:signal transduction histidine kinase